MHQQVQAVMKPKSKTPRERKHKDGAANQLSARKMNQEPPAGSVILNFEQTTGADVKEAMDEAKTKSVKEEVKVFAQQVRERLARGDTPETIK